MPSTNDADRPRPSDSDRASFGKRVRAARKERKLTQEALAAAVGTTTQTLRAWENGRTGITEPMMRNLAKAFEVDPEDLWPGWDPTVANWGGRRKDREPGPVRLDRIEAEIAALRAELEAKGLIDKRPDATELLTHLEQLAEQADQRDAGQAAPRDASRLRQTP